MRVGYDPTYGARPLKRAIQKEIESNLARLLLQGKIRDGQTVLVGYDSERNELTFTPQAGGVGRPGGAERSVLACGSPLNKGGQVLMRRLRRLGSCLFLPGAASFAEIGLAPGCRCLSHARGLVGEVRPGWSPAGGHTLSRCKATLYGCKGPAATTLWKKVAFITVWRLPTAQFERQVEFPISLEQARITTEYQAGMLLVHIQTEEERS